MERTLANFDTLRIIVNKQHATRTGTDQAADLTITFKIPNCLQHTVTVEEQSRLPIKSNIKREFTRLATKGILRLSCNKQASLINYLASTPESVVTKAVTPCHVQRGFLKNGMIDANSKELPDFDHILSTCRTEIPKELYTKIVKDFPLLSCGINWITGTYLILYMEISVILWIRTWMTMK
eukprot:scaffold10618_cov55-Attheya_sp.AAC.2